MKEDYAGETDGWPLELNLLAAELGSNHLLTQGPGGNVSLKADGKLWIKASGTKMKNALKQRIFVGLDLAEVRKNIRDGVENFTPRFGNRGSQMRASIETAMHAEIEAPVVAHVHSVGSMAFSVLKDPARAISIAKDVYTVAWTPYVKPGNALAHELRRSIDIDSRAALLGNHGLTVWGNSYQECTQIIHDLEEVWREALGLGVIETNSGSTNWIDVLASGIIVPDEIVFLKDHPFEINYSATSAFDLLSEANKEKVNSSDWLRDFIEVLEVVARSLNSLDEIRYLSESEKQDLIHWDAEKYRQAIE